MCENENTNVLIYNQKCICHRKWLFVSFAQDILSLHKNYMGIKIIFRTIFVERKKRIKGLVVWSNGIISSFDRSNYIHYQNKIGFVPAQETFPFRQESCQIFTSQVFFFFFSINSWSRHSCFRYVTAFSEVLLWPERLISALIHSALTYNRIHTGQSLSVRRIPYLWTTNTVLHSFAY